MEGTLLRPVVNEYDALTSVGKTAMGRVLLDRGDHVEWRDGDLAQRWTLPDQPRQTGTPVLTSLIVADAWFKTWRMDVPERYVLLADEQGRTMTVLALITTAAGPTYEQLDFDRVWPKGSFDQLTSRGVTRVEESYPDLGALNRAPPRGCRTLASRRRNPHQPVARRWSVRGGPPGGRRPGHRRVAQMWRQRSRRRG